MQCKHFFMPRYNDKKQYQFNIIFGCAAVPVFCSLGHHTHDFFRIYESEVTNSIIYITSILTNYEYKTSRSPLRCLNHCPTTPL